MWWSTHGGHRAGGLQEAILSFHPMGLRNQTQLSGLVQTPLPTQSVVLLTWHWNFVQSGLQSTSYSVVYISVLWVAWTACSLLSPWILSAHYIDPAVEWMGNKKGKQCELSPLLHRSEERSCRIPCTLPLDEPCLFRYFWNKKVKFTTLFCSSCSGRHGIPPHQTSHRLLHPQAHLISADAGLECMSWSEWLCFLF